MADPAALGTMSADRRQELKEAVCDAILERTFRIVSGAGEHGRIVLGDRPSRVLASGFILPRLNADGDDESSDIRIAAHGMDLRLRLDAGGTLTVQPTFSVYVRALPTAAELFERNGRLIPPADLSRAAKRDLQDKIRARLGQRADAAEGRPRAAIREEVAREVMAEMGIVIPSGARVAGVAVDDEAEAPDLGERNDDIAVRARIPNSISRLYDVPHKWVRIQVTPPPMALDLPASAERWQAIVTGYTPRLLQAASDACRAWISSPEGAHWAWRPGNVPSEAFWSAPNWEAFLMSARGRPLDVGRLVPQLDVQILVDLLVDRLDPQIGSLRLAFENLRERDDDMEYGLFGVSLDVHVPAAALVPMRLERVQRSYHLAGFLSMPAVGVNGGVDDRGERDGVRRLKTTWMPRYVLPRMEAAVLPAVPVSYRQLCDEGLDTSALGAIAEEMRRWVGSVETNTRLSWPGEVGTANDEALQEARFRDDIEAWRREAERIAKGADVLRRAQGAWREDPGCVGALPYRAWLLLNATFSAAAASRTTSGDPGWRLFQLAFVLAHLPTLTSRLPGHEGDFDASFDEDSASLLYMATGGGKTEAFFGIIVYALFLDRLRGKQRGITAMMHYPLRLLTIQQAQRLARLLAVAEIVRRREGIAGSAFEIGFWVGGANTPNRTEERGGKAHRDLLPIPTWQKVPIARESELIDGAAADKGYVAARDAWNKVPACPFCGGVTGLRLFPERRHRLGIVCRNLDGCQWNQQFGDGRSSPEPLPFLLADSDIYRRAPSIILGTVDKLALLGQNTHTINRIAGMFGLARFVDGGMEGLLDSPDRDPEEVSASRERVAPAWSAGREVFLDPFPSLIVQDEMHLLDESLGTFGGVFETGLFAWLREIATLLGPRCSRVPGAPDQPRLPHVIGATATAADAAKHVAALYQKNVLQFPHPGPSILDGFYVRLAGFEAGTPAYAERIAPAGVSPRAREAAAPWARVYASLMTNGRLHTVTTLSVLAAHAATITRWLRDLTGPVQTRRRRAATEMLDSISETRWQDRRREALRAEMDAEEFERLASVVDLHRIELTYVTNKKGGDQILSAVTSEVLERHAAMGSDYLLRDFRMELISGGVDVKGIQAVIRKAEEPFEPGAGDLSDALRGIVATSAISHGVDVEIFNSMAFAGMPADVAEYIQASSRVGRTHVGFSLLVPTPQARRDRFVVSVHESFHRLLERMIAPPAIERWADRALERTVPSLVQMWLAGVHYQNKFVAADAEQKFQVRFPGTVEAVDAVFKGVDGPRNFDACVEFVRAAVGTASPVGGPGGSVEYYRDLVQNAAEAVRREIGSRNFTGSLSDFWKNEQNPLRRRKPMTSLRDVDEAGTILGSTVTLRNRILPAADLAAAMTVLRNRGISRGRQTAASEADGEE